MSDSTATYHELNRAWPWKLVLQHHKAFTRRRYDRILPQYEAIALNLAIHKRTGARSPTAIELMPEHLLPDGIEKPGIGEPRFTLATVEAFELALTLGLASNALFATLHAPDLRASGWSG